MSKEVNEWANECMNTGWLNEWTDEWMTWKNWRKFKGKNEFVNKLMHEWMKDEK